MAILKDSSTYVLGELLSKAIPFLLLPYLTRELGSSGFGELSYYQMLIALCLIFVGFSQEGAIARYFYFYGKRTIALIVGSGLIYSLTVFIFFSLVALLVQSDILFYVIFCATTQAILAAQLSLRQCQKKAFSYLIIQLISSVSSIIFTLILFRLLEPSPVFRLHAIYLANIVAIIFACFKLKSLCPKFIFSIGAYKKGMLFILGFGFPLIFHHVSFFIKGQVDRIFIYNQFSLTELGIYSAGVQLASILSIFLLAINKACVPYYYEALKKERISVDQIKKYALYGCLIAPIPALITWCFPRVIFDWILGPGFEDSSYYTIFFMLGFGFNIPYLICVNYFFFYGKNGYIAKTTFFSSLLYIFCLVIFSNISIKILPLSMLISNIYLVASMIYKIQEIKKQ